jgi:MoaA/NifB/PqqE/SkfB family radical SAM enzyme
MPDAGIPDWKLGLLWLELTNRCQLSCVHCYAGSGPDGKRGEMTSADWRLVVDQAADAGFHRVTFIGGEPTLNRDLPALAEHSLHRGLLVTIFSNLMHVPPEIWRIAASPDVRLETSYYSTSAAEHDMITGVRGSHALTSAAIQTAVGKGATVHVALIEVSGGQQAASTRHQLHDLGIVVSGSYPVRPVGRAAGLVPRPETGEFCGRCAFRTVAIDCDGNAYPCVFARNIVTGNVRREALAEILSSQHMYEARRAVCGSVAKMAADSPRHDRCAP